MTKKQENKKTLKKLLKKHDIKERFGHLIENEIKKINLVELKKVGRRDLSNLLTFSLDSNKTLDIDDAFSYQLKEDKQHLYVHISDVMCHIENMPHTLKEAEKRMFSIYMDKITIPMLPQEISEDIASLKADGKEKKTITFEFVFDSKLELLDFMFYESFILVDYNLTHADLWNIKNIDNNLYADFKAIEKIADKTKENRMKSNSLEYYLNSEKQRLTDFIIKELMLLVNQSVAAFFSEHGYPLIFRTHDSMNQASINRLNGFLNKQKIQDKPLSYEGKDIVEFILKQDKKKQEEIGSFLLKNMKNAKYYAFQKKHFALGLNSYAHVTAPIRRFADLYNQKIIKHYIHNNLQYESLNELLNKEGVQVAFKARKKEYEYSLFNEDYEKIKNK